jgi:mannose-1-phosphate guanylyltransferase
VAGRIGTAFVLGAGLGTRLRPLTLVRPKPLIPIFCRPLITFALDHLCAVGVESFVINTHHLAEQFENLFADNSYSGRSVRLVYEPDLLETGGGIKNAQPWIGNDPFIVCSGDILTDVDIERLIDEHFRRGNDVTLALRQTGLAAGLTLGADGRVIEIKSTPGQAASNYDFANISVWNPGIFERIPPGKKTSFVPILVDWLRAGGRIGGVVLNDGDWFNIGSRADYLSVHRAISERRWRPGYLKADWPVRVAPDASIATTAILAGSFAVGAGCVVEDRAIIEDSILWEDARIKSQAILRSCVVAGSLVISGRHENLDLTEPV